MLTFVNDNSASGSGDGGRPPSQQQPPGLQKMRNVCPRCGRFGHRFWDCTHNCAHCGRPDHFREACDRTPQLQRQQIRAAVKSAQYLERPAKRHKRTADEMGGEERSGESGRANAHAEMPQPSPQASGVLASIAPVINAADAESSRLRSENATMRSQITALNGTVRQRDATIASQLTAITTRDATIAELKQTPQMVRDATDMLSSVWTTACARGEKEGFANGEAKGFQTGQEYGQRLGFKNGEKKGYERGTQEAKQHEADEVSRLRNELARVKAELDKANARLPAQDKTSWRRDGDGKRGRRR